MPAPPPLHGLVEMVPEGTLVEIEDCSEVTTQPVWLPVALLVGILSFGGWLWHLGDFYQWPAVFLCAGVWVWLAARAPRTMLLGTFAAIFCISVGSWFAVGLSTSRDQSLDLTTENKVHGIGKALTERLVYSPRMGATKPLKEGTDAEE